MESSCPDGATRPRRAVVALCPHQACEDIMQRVYSQIAAMRLAMSNRERRAAQVFGPLHPDEHTKALLFRIALFLWLDEPLPNLLIYRAGLVDFRDAIEARNAAPRQQAGFAQRRLAEEDGDLGAIRQVGIGRPSAALPQRKVLVVKHHCAAARGDLSIAIR